MTEVIAPDVAGHKKPPLLAQLRVDLAPFPFRAALTWRIALLCALVVGTAMMYGTFEAAISCYLVIFLSKPDAVVNIGTGIGLIVVVTIVVALMIWVINLVIVSPLVLMLAMALASFVFLYIGAASQLGEMGGIVGLVIAFVLSLVYMAPLGDAVSIALRYAWYMVAMPMAWMVVFNLAVGLSPVRLLKGTLLRRLATAADAISSGAPARHAELAELMRADNGALLQQAASVRVLNLVPRNPAQQVASDVRAGYRLMLAASALPEDTPPARRTALVDAIRAAAAALEAGHMPAMPTMEPANPAERELIAALAVLAGAPEPEVVAAPKPPFFFPDALTNPDYQRFALKTTAAAMICYLIYTGLDWQGIHTAMITCYVAALGTTGETVHKLGLRIVGCLIGATLGMGSVLFVIPQLESVGGLMVLVFVCMLIAAWVSTGPERIAYGGVQIGLAFLLTVIQGFSPGTSLDSGWDRIVGILLGNVVVYLIFTHLWPMPIEKAARAHLKAALDGLSRLAALAPERRAGAVPDAALVENEVGKAEEALALLPFEPRAIRPTPETTAKLRAAGEEIAALGRDIYLSREALPGAAARLASLAARIDGGTGDAGVPQTDAPGTIGRRLDRLQRAVTS